MLSGTSPSRSSSGAPEFGHLGLADHDRARRAQPADDLGVGWSGVRVRPSPAAGDLAGDVDLILDGDRDAEQRRKIALSHPSIDFVRLLERPLAIHRGEGVELAVEPIDPAKRHLNKLPRGDGTAANQLDLARQARERHILTGHSPILKAPDGPVQNASQRCRSSNRPGGTQSESRAVAPLSATRAGARSEANLRSRRSRSLLVSREAVAQTSALGAKQQRAGEPSESDASGALLTASGGSARLICLDTHRWYWRSTTNNFRSVTFVQQPHEAAALSTPRRAGLNSAAFGHEQRRCSCVRSHVSSQSLLSLSLRRVAIALATSGGAGQGRLVSLVTSSSTERSRSLRVACSTARIPTVRLTQVLISR